MWLQKKIQLSPKARGFHLVTDEIISQMPEMHRVKVGIAHFLLQHTSASLSINENADSSVRRDMESHFNELAPEDAPYYEHTCEGPDDIPAHIKSGLLGAELSIPVGEGRLLLGTWQGLYLGEHRNHAGSRSVVVTIQGAAADDS
ncbi:MAG: secondary thiamine-phosphate synthase enzyme YjbQ [Gammaproteobacteria bacterium]|nr:secondary thiamine-phosphate synthase enzyme YjbQ [Gammaproteobacteria bacterium]MDD9896149.1 secondary thiamine-phosphate synthase enzyme YjbQ [Gammaproteobacteria bacterium]